MHTEPGNPQDAAAPPRPRIDRRTLFTAGAALAAGAAGATVLTREDAPHRTPAAAPPPAAVPFHGARQAGVTHPQLPATRLLALDLPADADRAALRALLAATGNVLARAADGTLDDPRLDGTPPVTTLAALGPALTARLRLPTPDGFAELPALPGDRLDPARSGGDLLLQVSAGQPWTTGVLTEHLLAATTAAGAVLRWHQSGFLPPTPDGQTPRNLFGFKDGTANPDPADPALWQRDGTVLVYRRIRMDTAAFAALPADRRDLATGRRADTGAPLTGSAEHDDPDIYAKHPDGSYVIPATAHVRLSSPRLDGGARMLRRGWSYDDAPTDRGLLFCAFMRDPALFTRVQTRLAERDALTPFLTHTASAVGWVLPGVQRGGTLGEGL
ncbi:Dyp-type peroxidase [Kitasatospora phosalacinea]|uniref:Peroxidase n=1 Tax=Kitasatospora phosalacinea TaxID=2065 RepID=A0A9W6PF47_9ACTN|nr:Dyp-type peroxidase [Kitasatospora phosalacinea]GLW53731.1 peroxidase [Kitasatospora phosalacinea]